MISTTYNFGQRRLICLDNREQTLLVKPATVVACHQPDQINRIPGIAVPEMWEVRVAKAKFGAQQRTEMANRMAEAVGDLRNLAAPGNARKAETIANKILEDLVFLDQSRVDRERKTKSFEANRHLFANLRSRDSERQADDRSEDEKDTGEGTNRRPKDGS